MTSSRLLFHNQKSSTHGQLLFWCLYNRFDLRVVQTQAILFLKSMSVRVGSDIERLRILSDVIFEADCIQIVSRSKSEPHLSDIDFKNELARV